MKNISHGEGNYRVFLCIHETGGHGLCAFLFGGELPHVGGTVVAVPRSKTSGSGLTCDVSSICVPGHKDVELAQRLAVRLATAIGETVSLTVGVHIDGAMQKDIALLTDNAMAALEQWLEEK